MAAAPLAAKIAARSVVSRHGRRHIVIAAVGIVAGVLLFLLLLAALLAAVLRGRFSSDPDSTDLTPPATGARPASAEAIAEIPDDYFEHYARAAARQGIDWAVLAGVGKVECDHGRSTLEGCDSPGTVNQAGARGPMQFLGSTWRATASTFQLDVAGPPIPFGLEAQGYATDGSGDGVADPWDPADAVHAAARMLGANGAPDDYQAAIFAYNRSNTYVADVLDHAARYRADPDDSAAFTGGTGDVPLTDVDCPGGGTTTVHRQLVPVIEALYAQSPNSLCGGGYRNPERQIELRRQNCGTSEYAIYEMPSSQCSPPTARPGNSMHERGLAIDITCDGTLISTQADPCWRWLDQHAADYGLHNLPSEPWHWSISGD